MVDEAALEQYSLQFLRFNVLITIISVTAPEVWDNPEQIALYHILSL
jgi:hypothetical protein